MHRAASEARRQAKALKALMFGLTAAGGETGARAADAMRTAREAVFVITDMESSTAQAATSAAGASSVQAIYDTARACLCTHFDVLCYLTFQCFVNVFYAGYLLK